MVNFKNWMIAVFLGLALAWGSVTFIGIGAAVAVPADLLNSMMQVSPVLAFTLIDFITIAIPLAAVFLIVALICRAFIRKTDAVFYVLLLAPLVAMQLYGLYQSQELGITLVSTSLRYFLLAVCFYFLVRQAKSANS